MAHVSPYVIIWTILAAIGLILNLIWLIETWGDNGNLLRSGVRDGDPVIVSRAAIRNAVGRVLIKVLFLAIGLESAAAEMGAAIPRFSDIFSWEFIIAILVLTFLSYA